MADSVSFHERVAHSRAVLAARRRVRRSWRAFSEYEAPATALIAAARRGDVAEIDRLLDTGADPNAQSPRGRTALHDAAARDRVEAAARLLARSANPGLADRTGRTALDPRNTPLETLHEIRQRYHRRRTHDDAAWRDASDDARRWAAELDQKGVVKVSGLVGPDLLARLRSDFQSFIDHLEASRSRGRGAYKHYDEEEHFWAEDRAFVCNNAFKYSQAFARFCCSTPLLEAANLYLGRTPHIQRGGAMRYLPSPTTSHDMFGWHHDMEEKRFKIMLLLTGVGGGGQHMSFIVGSHKLFHPYRMFLSNSCSREYCQAQMGAIEVFDAVGEAGDVFIFDSNGAHRGNRRESADVRDVFMVEYTADGSHIWGGDVEPRIFDGMRLAGPNPFVRLMSAKKIWEQPMTRRLPTWVGNLPHIERWL